MTVCKRGHDRIEFEGDECPLCEALAKIEALSRVIIIGLWLALAIWACVGAVIWWPTN